MALNFDKINLETENVSLEDLSIESLVQGDLDPSSITFNDLFEDHLSVLRTQNNNENTEDNIFELDIDCEDLDKVWISDCDIANAFEFDNINITDFDNYHSSTSLDNDIISVNDDICIDENNLFNKKELFDTPKKNSTIIRRQSSRIENQTRKKIAEQIQRENVRLAMEAQLLNNKGYENEKKICVHMINGRPVSPATERYLNMPTDLDAEEEDDDMTNVDITSDEDPNKVWCLCRKPHGERFMICCDNCSEWYHGDCVGISQKEGDDMDEFICPSCKKKLPPNVTLNKSEEVVIIEDEDDDKELIEEDDEDCLITKAVEPIKFNENIFQLINKSQNIEIDITKIETSTSIVPSLSKRTSICLCKTCKTLVNPKKSLYCSRNCIEKYTKMVIKNNLKEKAKQYGLPKGPKLAKMTRFVLAQPATDTIQDEFAAPTEDNLKEFLIKNPTYKVYQNSKPLETKESQEKSKKFLELVNNDPSQHIKIVKLFATLFKKFMLPKLFNLEFRNIWQHCVNIEMSLFESCDKVINDKYMSKAKELSQYLKSQGNDRMLLDILHNKLTTTDFVSMTKDQLDSRSKVIIIDDPPTLISDKVDLTKRNFIVSNKGGISLLSDTTHLHGRHLYDINCKVCNGTHKGVADIKLRDKDSLPVFDNAVSSCTELSAEGKITYSSNNDEFAVSSSVETPDMVLDMEICSSSSEKEDLDSKINRNVLIDNSVDSSSIEQTNAVAITNTLKPQKRKLTSLWQGNLTYKEVGTVMCKSYLVTRFFLNNDNEREQLLPEDDEELREFLSVNSSMNSQIIISGRSQMSETHTYLRRLRKHSNKEFLVLRLHPSNLDEGGQIYRTMFDFLHSRERCGVISDKKVGVKDCFIYPLNAHMKIPSIFMPFIGPGLEKRRPHLLLLIIVRTPLFHINYQPFSPKYDHDDDFIKKHGINLEKYSVPNLNFSFCPSPISNSNDVVKWVLNSQYGEDEKEVELTENPSESPKLKIINLNHENKLEVEEEYPGKLSNIDSSKEKIKNTKKIRKSQKSRENSDNACNDWSDISTIKLCDIPLPESMPPDILEKDIINQKSSIIPLGSKVLNREKPEVIDYSSPIEAILKTMLINKPEMINNHLATDKSKKITITDVPNALAKDLTFEKSAVIYNTKLDEDTMKDIIMDRSEVVTFPSHKDISKTSTMGEVPLTEKSEKPDISLRPTAFVYKFLAQTPSIQPFEPCSQHDYEAKHLSNIEDASVFNCNSDERCTPEVVENNIMTSSPNNLDFGGDIDLRANSQENLDPVILEDQLIQVSSQSLFLKRKHSSRLYTFYDCFPSDINSERKRMKYFFNPFYQKADFINIDNGSISPLIIKDIDEVVNENVDVKMNISWLSPNEISHKT